MDEKEIIEGIVQEIMGLLDELAEEEDVNAAHMVMAAQAVAVRLCWAAAKDRSEVRQMLGAMIDDFVTQTEHGGPMVTQ